MEGDACRQERNPAGRRDDHVPWCGQDAPAGGKSTASPKTTGASQTPPGFMKSTAATAGAGSSGRPRKFRPAVRRSDL